MNELPPLLQRQIVHALLGMCQVQQCNYCNKTLPIEDFPTRTNGRTGIKYPQKRCQPCISASDIGRNEARKKAFPYSSCINDVRPPIGSQCELTGRVSYKQLVFDHSRETNEFRGWIEANVNQALGAFGDNAEGIIKALNYMLDKDKIDEKLITKDLIPLRNKLNEIIDRCRLHRI